MPEIKKRNQVETEQDTTEKWLKPYTFHGMDFQVGDTHGVADCPFCSVESGKHNKFSVDIRTGVWQCWNCKEGTDKGGGNVYTFMQKLWEKSDAATNGASKELAKDRKLLDPMTVTRWGVCQSIITKEWLVPGRNPEGKIHQLYRYTYNRSTKKMCLLAMPGLNHQMFGIDLFDKKKSNVMITEGIWDAMALWEVMRQTKLVDKTYSMTANENVGLLSDTNIIGVPGCKAFSEKWVGLFSGKNVTLLFDNDHPKEANGKQWLDGYDGMRRASQILASATEPPESLSFLKWGKDGFDPSLKSGTDVRDMLAVGSSVQERIRALPSILDRINPIPADWVQGRTKDAKKNGGTEIECLECRDWSTLVNQWRKAMKWTEGLDRALSVMLASVLSTRSLGDQLWMKIIGPAACGKSTLCEALSVNKKHIKAISTLRGFHSGFRDPDGGENSSLILKLQNKTLVTKDGDTILQMPDKERILSEARDLYDTTARSDYRNGMGMDHEGIRMTWLLCGTSSLRQLDQSELGARFLDCVIMEGIDDDLEDEINLRVANKAKRNVSQRSNCRLDSQYDPSMLKAMQLTGGYIDTLCNDEEILATVDMDDEHTRQIIHLAKFVAFMRARPSIKQTESAEREFSTRLVSQHIRLAMCLTCVISKKSVDEEVMRRVRQTALDTARGKTLEIARQLFEKGELGISTDTLAIWHSEKEEKIRSLMGFLGKIGVAELFNAGISRSHKKPMWKLTAKMRRLYAEVMGNASSS